MQNSIYKIKYLLFLSWDREAGCLTVWGVIPPPERNTAWNKGRKYFHCLGAPNNLIRPCWYYKSVSIFCLHVMFCTKHLSIILYFKLSPCPECCMLSSGWFPGVWIVYADVSEHSVCSIFIGRQVRVGAFYTHLPAYEDGTECSETSAYKIQTPGNHPKESIQHSVHGESLKSRCLESITYRKVNMAWHVVSEFGSLFFKAHKPGLLIRLGRRRVRRVEFFLLSN